MTLPGPVIMLIVFLLCVEVSDDVIKEFGDDVYDLDEILDYFYVHFAFWICIAVKATDISQVLLPMFLMVRPFHCLVLMLALKITLPRY